MPKREELEAALAKAEIALAKAVVNATRLDGDLTEANTSLGKARAYCRQARAALTELDRSMPTAISGAGVDTLIRQLGEVSGREAGASPPLIQSSAQDVRGENKRSRDESGQGKPIHQFNTGSPAQELGSGVARARPSILRHAVGLLALTLAYLLYFHIDVQLQIVSLPSIIALPLQ